MPEQHATRIARQPFTFGGVARFASARIGRLLVTALVFGTISGIVVSWFMARCIAPVLDEAIEKLPQTGEIEYGVLRWPEKTSRLLAANTFTSLEVRPDDFSGESAPVDFAFEFRTNALVVKSLLGTQKIIYPPQFSAELNRTVLLPAWGASRAPVLIGLIPATALLLLLTWVTLGFAYCPIPWLLATFANRQGGFIRAWKLCMAAQLPGSVIMAFALALYSTGQISVLFVIVMFFVHFLPTFLHLLVSPFFLPKAAPSGGAETNPFDQEPRKKSKRKNPFSTK